jgi:hypothetical protein
MNILGPPIVRLCSLWIALGALLALMVACGAQPASVSPTGSQRAPEQGLEQNAPSTPEFDVVQIEPDAQVSPGDLEAREQSDCPDLDSVLFQITQAPDPLDLAEQLGLTVREDRVQVLLILDCEDAGFLRNFEVEIGTQVGTQVQAFVPVDQLCDLANTSEVLAIRLSAQAVPQ